MEIMGLFLLVLSVFPVFLTVLLLLIPFTFSVLRKSIRF